MSYHIFTKSLIVCCIWAIWYDMYMIFLVVLSLMNWIVSYHICDMLWLIIEPASQADVLLRPKIYQKTENKAIRHTRRSSAFHMAQTRKRVFVVLVRKDVCPHASMVQNIGELVTKVLPHAFDSPFGGGGTRERVHDLLKCNRTILKQMDREPTFPPPAKDRGNRGLWKSVCCKGFFPFLIDLWKETIH